MHSLLFLQSDQNPVFCWYFQWEQQQVVDNWISNTQSYLNFMERKKIHPVHKKIYLSIKNTVFQYLREAYTSWLGGSSGFKPYILLATLSFHWVEFFPLVKPRNGWVDYKLSPQPPLTQGWVIGWHGKWVTIQFWMNYPFYKTTVISTKLLRILLII